MSDTISLIPDSLIQFDTVRLNASDCARLRCSFWEDPTGVGHDGSPETILRPLEYDPDHDALVYYVDGMIKEPPEGQEYTILRKDVLEMLEEQWVPLPYFAMLGETAAAGFQSGPSNWVRGRLRRVENENGEEEILLNLAFDTTLCEIINAHYTGPTQDDASRNQRYAFVSDLPTMSWMLESPWLKGWIEELYKESQDAIPGRRRVVIEDPDVPVPVLRAQAIYLSFLNLLAQAAPLPFLRLLNTEKEIPVSIDLVLDLGNFRSCGIMIEEHPGTSQREVDSYILELRDLARPEKTYDEPFSSRIEFGRAAFGRDFHSRRSGRDHAFLWPCPVRTGPEAERMMASRLGIEGMSGISTPKRYLWNTRPSRQGWRFNNGLNRDGQISDPLVNGPFRRELLALLDQTPKLRVSREDDRNSACATGPCVLSRSLLFTLMLEEVLLQALSYMNSHAFRTRRRDSTRRRKLRSVVLTMPPGMPVAEQRIFRKRAETAIAFAWASAKQKEAPPKLRAELDEATATQIVWLHNEVTERLGGHVDALFELYGKAKAADEPARIRVASMDIGGGTTDLMVTTYTLQSGDALSPHQDFRESFTIAGDDLLEAIIARLVIPPLEQALTHAGLVDADKMLNRALAKDHGDQDEQDRHRRKLFVSTVLEPAALKTLGIYENVDPYFEGSLGSFLLKDVVTGDVAQRDRCLAFLREQIERHVEGFGPHSAAASFDAAAFDPLEISIDVSTDKVERAIKFKLGKVLSDLSEVVWTYDCDVLLLSGRPSKLRKVQDLIIGAMPVPPHRIIAMHNYAIGKHYPFADSSDRINDPKTTVVVGAALCVQAEGRIQNFVLRTRNLKMRSTARIIGKMDQTGQIREQNVLLSDIDLDGPLPEEPMKFSITDFQGKTMIGFRQLPLERWTTSALYCLEFSQTRPPDLSRITMPLTVTLSRRTRANAENEEEQGDFSNREDFEILQVLTADDEDLMSKPVELTLQTTLKPEGYWRDTGCLDLRK